MANILALPGPNSKYSVPGARQAGFLAGLWHGIVAPLLFWISLFTPNLRVYEISNSGRWYDFGFLLGVGAWAAHHETRTVYQQGMHSI